MNIELLLDKKEALQVDIIRQLLFQNDKLTKQILAKKMNLTQNVLKEYLSDILLDCQSLGDYFIITAEEKSLQLDFSSDINFDKIVHYYLNQSLTYQILKFVFEHKKVSIFQLSQEFNSSEATIFRKLRELNKALVPFSIEIKNGQLVGDELQIRYFYYTLFFLIDRDFSSDDLAVKELMSKMQPEFRHTFSKTALKRLSCWLFVTRHRLMVANHLNHRLTDIQEKFISDALYQKLSQIMEAYFKETTPYVGKNEGAMFYCFLISFDILGEDNFAHYDLTRRKKISTAMLDTYSREMIVSYYGYQRLSISNEKRLTYKLSQIHAKVLCFHGQLNRYDRHRVHAYYQQHMTPELVTLITNLIETAQERLGLGDSERDFLWLNYANILVALNLSLYKNLSVGIDLANDTSVGESLYYFLLTELSSIPQVRFENYQEHHYYDLILTTTEHPISVKANHYYLSEFISPYDIEKIKENITQIKLQKNNYPK
ncbi:MAG: helix-turn-helix domain-containing protein [Lactococcus sp.]|nr:helix-turn-helix domain-containing protein [Lactococcus sp.]